MDEDDLNCRYNNFSPLFILQPIIRYNSYEPKYFSTSVSLTIYHGRNVLDDYVLFFHLQCVIFSFRLNRFHTLDSVLIIVVCNSMKFRRKKSCLINVYFRALSSLVRKKTHHLFSEGLESKTAHQGKTHNLKFHIFYGIVIYRFLVEFVYYSYNSSAVNYAL